MNLRPFPLLQAAAAEPVVGVSSAAELAAALQAAAGPEAPTNTTIELQRDITLAPAALGGARLPLHIASNHTLMLRGGEPLQRCRPAPTAPTRLAALNARAPACLLQRMAPCAAWTLEGFSSCSTWRVAAPCSWSD